MTDRVIIHRITARDLLWNLSKMSKLTVKLPPELLQTFKFFASAEGCEPEDILKEFVEDYCNCERSTRVNHRIALR